MFANAELRKIIKGKNVNTNFEKPSTLGKHSSSKPLITSQLSKSRNVFNNVHDVCVSKFDNDMNSRANTQHAKVLNIENKKKLKAKARKTKKYSKEVRIATPSVSPPRYPLDNLLDTSDALVDSKITLCKKQLLLTQWNQAPFGFQSPFLIFVGYRDLFIVRRLGLFQAYDRESKDARQFQLEVYGNC
ncbi:hypothetical protein Tco_0556627 [Tanacetum coccineum]